ncbi:MAG: ATP phosphoribosyltransferase regulatory subunit [Chromatiales bacterium]|nr:ATP phosphoribosyltransferase regulatory subunit [Chromatiales bacterium]
MNNKWLMPENIDDILPVDAKRLEVIRRQLLDLFDSWGYNLVNPPIVEFLESLVAANEDELLLQTFKLTDQLSGKTLGVRADMTPQIARIDAHALSANKINRLCYYGAVLKTKPEGVGRSRTPIQFGAEIYGYKGIESTIEIIQLMLKTLKLAGAKQSLLSLGHVGIYLELIKATKLQTEQNNALIPLLHAKAKHEIYAYLKEVQLSERQIEWFTDLCDCNGDITVLKTAQSRYSDISDKMTRLLSELKTVADSLSAHTDKILLDLSELPCYHYEAGIVFSAFALDLKQEVARGGCYDGVGEPFGRARPAVGFSGDIKLLLDINQNNAAHTVKNQSAIFAPRITDPQLQEVIATTRERGDRVIMQLGNEQAHECGCDRQFVKTGNQWIIETI